MAGMTTGTPDLIGPLQAASFPELLSLIEPIGANRGDPRVIGLYRTWIALQGGAAKHLHAAWFNLGAELNHAGARDDAILAFRSALALRPDFAPAALNLGLLQEQHGDPGAALATWSGALQPDDIRVSLLNQQARLREQQGHLDTAAAAMRASLIAQPDQPDVIQHWLHLRQRMCDWPVLADSIPGVTADRMMAACGPLASLALTDRIEAQTRVAAAWIARKLPPAPERLAPAAPYRHDRIRLGYLSSDFCRHAMSYLIAELFERHDRARFAVHGYCASPEDGSAIRTRIQAAFDHFTIIRDLDDQTAARAIRADKIDILIDLNGLTTGSRLGVLRWRPAPVQATYLGFVGPVPLPELDFLLCDDFVIPPDRAAAYQPRPLPVGPLYQANDTRRGIGPRVSRATAGLPEDRFVFCCFSNHYKITQPMFAVWMDILRAVEHGVLWLSTDNVWSRANLRAHAGAAGIDPDRLIFAERTSPEDYMARLPLADLFLDTSPYNAGTIASDALRMGLPMVTLCGEAFASRMAARLLTAIGAPEGVTGSHDAYRDTAIALARDPARLTAIRARLTPGAWAASLGGTEAFTRGFEDALARVHAHRMSGS